MPKRPFQRRNPPLVICAVLFLLLGGCSVRKFTLTQVGNALVGGSSVFASDDDPELVRDALPFALKTLESLLAEVPEHEGLLLGACRGFTQYTAAFVELDRARAAFSDFRRAAALETRARRLYLRATGYCQRALDLAFPGAVEALRNQPETALADATQQHTELLFWSAASWGAAIARGLDRPELVIDVPAVRRLAEVVLALDPDYDRGAIQEAMILLESVAAMGGSIDRARQHFDRAVELSGGLKASPYVAYAEAVAVPQQDFRTFERLLETALAVDPDASEPDRLANLLSHQRARLLLSQKEDLFFDLGDGEGEGSPQN